MASDIKKSIPSWMGCLLIIFGIPCSLCLGMASHILLDDYMGGLDSKWEEKSFHGKTIYQVVQEDDTWCIKAASIGSASALYYKIKYDLKEYPFLKWRWKVNRVIAKGDELLKEGDDYAARVYVVFPSLVFWNTRAINYIWANKLPVGKGVPNSFTSNAVMIAVESGPVKVGQWVEETRNVLQDYRTYFGKEPSGVGAIAIMTDTDNTGEEATAWYGPIRIQSGRD